MINEQDRTGLVTRGVLDGAIDKLTRDLTSGRILLPQVSPITPIFAGATNHAPNSDHSYSTAAATVPGTLPADAGDTNQEDYRYYRQPQDAGVDTVDPRKTLKAVGHSEYAAAEGANPEIPDWDRVNGWARMGSQSGSTQYDAALQLFGKIVGPAQRWFFNCRLGALAADIIPPEVELYAGLWIKAGAYEGWAKGDPFDLSYNIHGTIGSQNLNYRVMAKTDSGVSILSNVLNVPNAPDVLSIDDYPVVFFNAGPGFIEFEIYREDAGAYAHLFTVRNSIDLHYNDTGDVHVGIVSGWPADPGNAPLAYAKTRTLIVGPYGGTWAINRLTVAIPTTFNYSLVDADGMFLRFGFTSPTAVDRHIGVDQIMWSTQQGAWAPDVIPPFPDGTRPVPTISPTQGFQGGNDGLDHPPGDGTGGGLCICSRMPVLVRDGRRRRFKPLRRVIYRDSVIGEHRTPYLIAEIKFGVAAEYYILTTANGITYECNAAHELILDIPSRRTIQAQQVTAGVTKLASWVRGRKTKTLVVTKTLVPKPVEVGTMSLHHPQGLSRSGRGMYVAGFSKSGDRGLFSSNIKRDRFDNPE